MSPDAEPELVYPIVRMVQTRVRSAVREGLQRWEDFRSLFRKREMTDREALAWQRANAPIRRGPSTLSPEQDLSTKEGRRMLRYLIRTR